MSRIKQINLVIFGIGKVGSTLINQINSEKSRLLADEGLEINIKLIANSRLAFFAKSGVNNVWETDFDTFSVPYKIEEVISFVQKQKLENCIAIDATASTDFIKHYVPLIQNGFHIVAANKIANTLHQDFYKELRLNLKKYRKFFLYETNVGAGLPLIETLRSLKKSGDQVTKIRGVFSGSLSFLFNQFSEEEVPFSEIIKNQAFGMIEEEK